MSNGATRPDALAAAGAATSRSLAPRRDRFSAESAACLQAELVRQPEIRPEVVARARLLAADPTYPSGQVIKSVARQILATPDLSNDES